MPSLPSLIQELESGLPSVRDKAALALMDLGDESAVEPLLKAIAKPENVNHRGTLVYALSGFNCAPYVELLVDLALSGNFEVSTGAYVLLEKESSEEAILIRIARQLSGVDPSKLALEHHHDAYQALVVLASSGHTGALGEA